MIELVIITHYDSFDHDEFQCSLAGFIFSPLRQLEAFTYHILLISLFESPSPQLLAALKVTHWLGFII